MSSLMVDFITSLDSYGTAEGWPGYWGMEGPEYLDWLEEDGKIEYTTLMGATTYREMSGYAAEMPDDPGLAALTAMPKVVFSSTLEEPLSWASTELVEGDAVEAVQDMKRRDSRPLPGKDRLFEGYPDIALDLVDSRTFDGRLQLLEYVPTVLDGPPGVGD
jgi:RibD C-terminal domain